MIFDNSRVRRQDRLLNQQQSMTLLRSAEYGVLSMVDGAGQPYAVPVNYVWDGADAVYIHCAPEGEKLRAIAAHPEVMLCVVGATHLMPERFTTEYQSILLRGVARVGLSEVERRHALDLLLEKLAPHHKPMGQKYVDGSFHRVEIIRIDLLSCSGKQKNVTPHHSTL
ncbi:MAG: pyridoxamine 5'-phosphate oxidase family protein [Paludibacteraceae bacterium]|nr:pyridoxamine 5'-phosphate oxidase family protein [Paludibacteraceae bacterium]